MKIQIKIIRFLAVLVSIAVASFISADEEEREWYVYGGLSLYAEDKAVTIGGGVGGRAGLGFQWSRKFAFELAWDSPPDIDADSYKKYVLETLDISEQELRGRIKPERNGYLAVLATSSVAPNPSISLIGKIGVARFWRSTYLEFVSGNVEEQDYSAVVSGGLRIKLPRWDQASLELTLTHYAKDLVKTSFLSASIRFPFPRG